jgi:hypothetical protein
MAIVSEQASANRPSHLADIGTEEPRHDPHPEGPWPFTCNDNMKPSATSSLNWSCGRLMRSSSADRATSGASPDISSPNPKHHHALHLRLDQHRRPPPKLLDRPHLDRYFVRARGSRAELGANQAQ